MSFWQILLEIMTVAGALGLFLYGMKLMSESLQKVAGKRMRKILSAISSKPSKGILSGLLITGLIQSSSATTVMVVSFVNAGLISLSESFGVILGANIGTTVTGWIISLLGFGRTFDINLILLPMIALSLPLLFSPNSRLRIWAEFIIGFVILFLALNYLKEAAPSPEEVPGLIAFIGRFTHDGYGSILIFVLIGMVFTIIFQSSSAMMAFTFVLAIDGWIAFDFAAAMVLGENLGTTITANIAAIVGNVDAKRSAFFHFLFNLIGVLWALAFFHLMLRAVDYLVLTTSGGSPFADTSRIPIALALFHTSFNILNTILVAGFLKYIREFIVKVIRGNRETEIQYRLKYINSFYLSTSELSIIQAKKEIANYGKLARKMFLMIPELLMEKRTKKYKSLYKKIIKYEEIIDNIEIEIASYLGKLSESKLSLKGTRETQAMLKIISEIESIGDACFDMARTIEEKNNQKLYFIQDQRNNLRALFTSVEMALSSMVNNLDLDIDEVEMEDAVNIITEIKTLVATLKKQHIESINKDLYSYQAGVYYIDLIESMDKIAVHTLHISDSIYDTKASP